MMILLILTGLLMFDVNFFVGIFMYLVSFIFLLFSYSYFGMDMFKGEVFGSLGFDYISLYMVLLLMWLMSLILVLFYTKFLYIFVLMLIFSMMIVFMSMDLLGLFICFEFSMLPMFLIIMFWGFSKERYEAGIYMFIYTMVSSLPMLIISLIILGWSGSLCIDYMLLSGFDFDSWVGFTIVFMFLVKVPMFMVHIWLPKAHVEAPVFGSMILASIMLKMGGYGVIRSMYLMIWDNFIDDFFFSFCLCGSVMVSYFCLYQLDLKVLVAYSSIVHMGMMLMGFFSGSELGYLGGIIMMISHGMCSSGMFYLVNEIYSVSGSRILMLNKGSMGVMPILVWMWLVMLVNNLGVPPCFGILGELMLMSGSLSYMFLVFLVFVVMVFFVSCFVINMFIFLLVGKSLFDFILINMFTYYGSIMHLIPLNFFIFFLLTCL